MLAVLCAVFMLLSGGAFAQETADAIVQRSVEANRRDWNAAPQFDCREQDRTSNGTKTYEDTMILGSPYQRLVAVNGQPLNAAQAAEEQRKLERTISERKSESSQRKAARIAKYQDDLKRNRYFMEQMTEAFEFKLLGNSKLDGHEVYVLNATPRPGYHPPNMATQALMGMRGKLWIDKATYQWVKVEARVTRPVSIEGFLAQVEPGTRFELEKEAVAPGIWLPKHFAMQSRARILYLIPHQGQEDDRFFDYQKSADAAEAASSFLNRGEPDLRSTASSRSQLSP